MITKCFCQHCRGHIEFEAEHTGTVVACPHCGKETTLDFKLQPQATPKQLTQLNTTLKASQAKVGRGHISIYAVVASLLLVASVAVNVFLYTQSSQVSNLNRQIADLEQQNQQIMDLKQQLAQAQQALISANQANVAGDKKAIEKMVCGIYEIRLGVGVGIPINKIELRSDGTAYRSRLLGDYGEQEMNKIKSTWTLNENVATISDGMKFTIEGDDLIDSKGNRWLRTR